jgi:hypothetical protein
MVAFSSRYHDEIKNESKYGDPSHERCNVLRQVAEKFPGRNATIGGVSLSSFSKFRSLGSSIGHHLRIAGA